MAPSSYEQNFEDKQHNTILKKERNTYNHSWDISHQMTVAEELDFMPQQGRDFYVLHVIQTGSGAHPPYYPVDTMGFLGR
jgi:hypothetical protein